MNVDKPSKRVHFHWLKKGSSHTKTDMHPNMIVAMLDHLPTAVKGHIVAFAGEFIGTFLFLLFGMGAASAVNNAPPLGENSTDLTADTSKLLFISLAFGFSLAINVWVFFRISGGLFNPAVVFGMMLIGAVKPLRGVIIFVAQIAGSLSASGVLWVLLPGNLNARTELGNGTTITQGLFIEMFLTAELVFTIFMLAAEKHAANFIAPIGIGLALFVAQMFGTSYTGSSLNPARSFGPAVVAHSFKGYHWIYWVGPGLGAILAAAFYKFIKALEYETVNAEKDPLEVVGTSYDLNSKREKLVTRDGHMVDLPDNLNLRICGGTVMSSGDSGETAVSSDLEAQR